MWFTRHFNLPVETAQGPDADQPGVTLSGGLNGLSPILAEFLDRALLGVQTDLEERTFGLESSINALNASAVVTLDTIFSGSGTNTTQFTGILQDYQHLAIFWSGNHDGSGHASLALRFNGSDGASSYISEVVLGTTPSGWDFEGASTAFSVLRAGMIGTTGSAGVVFIPSYNISGRKSAIGISAANFSGTPAIGIGSGYWAASTAPITSVRMWPSSQVWNTTPRISLVGIK